jgi:hypothetical protein
LASCRRQYPERNRGRLVQGRPAPRLAEASMPGNRKGPNLVAEMSPNIFSVTKTSNWPVLDQLHGTVVHIHVVQADIG